MVDFSYKRDVMREVGISAKSVLVLDHHKTAADDLADFYGPNYKQHFDMEHSGAMLAWMNYFPNIPPPLLIDHIEDRDLWRFALPGTREIQANVFSYPYDFDVWDKLMWQPTEELIAEGKAIDRKHHKDIAELVKVCQRRMTISGYDVPVASLPYTLVSDAAHMMAQGEPFAACYWDGPDGRNFGLRSTDEGADVGQVAKQYGGGGHVHAAGFKVPRDHILAQS